MQRINLLLLNLDCGGGVIVRKGMMWIVTGMMHSVRLGVKREGIHSIRGRHFCYNGCRLLRLAHCRDHVGMTVRNGAGIVAVWMKSPMKWMMMKVFLLRIPTFSLLKLLLLLFLLAEYPLLLPKHLLLLLHAEL